MNYEQIAKMTSVYLRAKFENQTPEEDVFDILDNLVSNQSDTFGFFKVCKLAESTIQSSDEIDIAQWIASEFYETDACDTCYSGFSKWVYQMQD